ncbi:MAG TPA: dienelactone hydrolase family protein [Arenicellales bacterium]|nr:dienelactone hydrolase family protein [Arenicellales bacterium]
MKRRDTLTTRLVSLVLLIVFATINSATARGEMVVGEANKVVYTTQPNTLNGYLCRPPGEGPFPAVLYNHGGLGKTVGGAPKESCEALAASGFVGFAPIRRLTRSMGGHTSDVQAGLDYLLELNYIDRNRIAMMGFSRGGALTFMIAAQAAPIRAAVIMASANPPPKSGFTLEDAGNIQVPILLLVAKNDTGSQKTKGQNTLNTMERMSAALTKAGNTPQMMVYPPYPGDGHEMFFEIGAYWTDVVAFLKKHL